MKIGLVLDDTLDTPDGVQQYVLTVGNWLANHGHEVHYLVGETKRTDLNNLHSLSRNLQVKFNGNHMSMPLPASRGHLKKLLTEQQYDILHVQVPYSPFLAGRLIRLTPPSTAVIGTFHVLPYGKLERWANRLLAVLNNRTAKRFDAMVAASPAAANFAHECYGFKTSVLPHPFDYQRFAVPPDTAPPIQLLYLARLVERKGARYFLQALHELQLRDQLPGNVRITIGGKGPLQRDLEAYVQAQGLQSRVRFTGFVPEANKAQLLASADIAVFPSTSGESFGISIIEALAAVRGVVLAGDNPGYQAAMPLPDQLLDPRDIKLFADKLAYWITHDSARAEANKSQREVAQGYDVNHVCEQLQTIYNEALQSRRKT